MRPNALVCIKDSLLHSFTVVLRISTFANLIFIIGITIAIARLTQSAEIDIDFLTILRVASCDVQYKKKTCQQMKSNIKLK